MNPVTLQLSIVICTYNRAQYLPNALRSLNEQSATGNSFEVIVVDNASTDGTQEVCATLLPQLTATTFSYHQEKQQGASFARNTGAMLANAPLLCFMDDDAVAHHDFVERIIDFFSRHPEAGGLGGRIIPLYIPEEPAWMSHYVSSLVGHFHYSKTVTQFRGGKFPFESNMTLPTALFRNLGGFNERLPGVAGKVRIGGEGKDLFLRLTALGPSIYYDPSVVVKHVVETEKLTHQYLTEVAQGIGRGERIRTLANGTLSYYHKQFEYILKLIAAILISAKYFLIGSPQKIIPLVSFRWEAIRGLNDKHYTTKRDWI